MIKTDLDTILEICEGSGWEIGTTNEGGIFLSCEVGHGNDFIAFNTQIDRDTTLRDFAERMDEYANKAQEVISTGFSGGRENPSFAELGTKFADLALALNEEVEKNKSKNIHKDLIRD